MKGIILAGGSGQRLYPLTQCMSKQLMPIYDKPMIYYSLSVLMLSDIKDVLIISTPEDLPRYEQLFTDGKNLGMHFEYKEQPSPDGLAQAFIIGKDFIGDDDVCLILGDNIFFGHGITSILSEARHRLTNDSIATVFGYNVLDPERYGVVDFDVSGKVLSIEEKPKIPKSNFAVTGLYFYPNDVIQKASEVIPSERGELEITCINQMFLDEQRLFVELMGRGYAWLDTGTHQSLSEASSFIEIIEKRQGFKIACIEEIAYSQGFISKNQLLKLALPRAKSEYGQYLIKLAESIE